MLILKKKQKDLNVSLNQKNVTNKGKAPKVVPGLSNSSNGSPMRAKVGVQWVGREVMTTTSLQDGPWVVDHL
jgi:hypothetical protein